ncbi:MAG TPA: hypothetical protein VKJ65_08595, partial [Phycisphaerae bacterium]|nr:hypothetical protein [Phycisphaerae bacterium]
NWPDSDIPAVETPWPIPRKRLEFSCAFVGAFGFLLIAAPVYLFFSRHIVVRALSLVDIPLMQTPAAMSLRLIEFAIGLAGLLLIPFVSRRWRSRMMLLGGLGVLAPMFIFLEPQLICLMIIAYPALALITLVSLDAITGIRPAVPWSDHFRALQFAASVGALLLWFPAAAVALHGRQIDALVQYRGTPLTHALILIGALSPFAAACVGLIGSFAPYRRSLNLSGRLLGTLGLSMSMCLGLYTAIFNIDNLFGPGNAWRTMEMLWMFMIVAGSLLLVWSGLTQRLIFSAAQERETQPSMENQ